MAALNLSPMRAAVTRTPSSQFSQLISVSAAASGAQHSQPRHRQHNPSPFGQWTADQSQRLSPISAVAEPAVADRSLPGEIPPQREAVLCQRFSAHTSALTTALVLTDTDDQQQIVTASLDKSVALWSATNSGQLPAASCGPCCLGEVGAALRITLPGAPVFSLALDSEATGSGLRQVFAGTSAKSVLSWEPPQSQPVENVALGGHTGWVRALATQGKWLFSCSCNVVRVWDMSRAVPRMVDEAASFTGDIVAATTGNGRLFTAGANGALRCWAIDSKTGHLTLVTANEHAHSDRVPGLAWRGGFLYTASADGYVRMWDAGLDLVTSVRDAHGGKKVNCLAIGPDGVVYTGGDDKLVRRWQSGVCPQGLMAEAAPPLYCHHAPVRTLAAGRNHTLVSGDKRGDVAVWRI